MTKIRELKDAEDCIIL